MMILFHMIVFVLLIYAVGMDDGEEPLDVEP